jgi:hypothetical protein
MGLSDRRDRARSRGGGTSPGGAFRTSDGSGVNKHYDLADAAELEDVLSELIGLIRDGALPPDAVTYRAP